MTGLMDNFDFIRNINKDAERTLAGILSEDVKRFGLKSKEKQILDNLLVPRDLEEVWPAGHYDIPVTGDWTRDEIDRVTKMIDSLVAKNTYRVIINHSGMEYQCDIPVIDTRKGASSTNHEALQRNIASIVKIFL